MRRFVFTAFLLIIVILQIPGEKVPYNDGAGWDGVFYREVAAGFLQTVEEDGYNTYHLQRILPFAILNALYVITGIEINNDSLIKGILIFNFLALLLGIYWYFRIAKKIRASAALETLGFILLFFSFPVLKETWYEPFITDLFALVLGIGQMNYFLRYEKPKLFLVSLIGGFVWPTLWISGLLLLYLPNEKVIQQQELHPFHKWYLIPGGLLLGLFCYAFFAFSEREGKSLWELARNLISMAAVLYFLLKVWQESRLKMGANVQLFQKKVKPERLIALIMGIIIFYGVVHLMAVGEPTFTAGHFAINLLIRPLQWPFNFLVNHFLYFGLLVPVAILFFPRVFREAGKLGIGFTMVFLLVMLLSLNSESRMVINYVPFILIPLLKAVRRYSIISKDLWILAVGNLLLSKFWYSINVHGIREAFETFDTSVYMTFPAQRYFQHFGPWQSPWMYLLYGVLFIAALVLVYFGKRRYLKDGSAPESELHPIHQPELKP